jgi:hypothetical protein
MLFIVTVFSESFPNLFRKVLKMPENILSFNALPSKSNGSRYEYNPCCRSCSNALVVKTSVIGQWSAECRQSPPQMLATANGLLIAWPMVNDNPNFYCNQYKKQEV